MIRVLLTGMPPVPDSIVPLVVPADLRRITFGVYEVMGDETERLLAECDDEQTAVKALSEIVLTMSSVQAETCRACSETDPDQCLFCTGGHEFTIHERLR